MTRLLLVAVVATTTLISSANAMEGGNKITDNASIISDEIDIHATDTSDQILLLPGRLFPLDFAGGEFTVHDTPLFIQEATNASAGPDGSTGLTVWDGSVVLAKYLESNFKSLQGQRVLEIGAGTGIVGLTASLLGASEVVVSDLSYCLPNLQAIVERYVGIKKNCLLGEASSTRTFGGVAGTSLHLLCSEAS